MRLHALSVTAFGPFADPVSVDFDDLSDAGLFLLTGPTGAGKSSVLDAVCFALYGQVPGDRQAARQLRCDRAPAGVSPTVVLECSIRGRRLRFTRSPAWERPKKRGTGTAKVQAHVVVEELRDAGWEGLTNRLDEAGHLVTDLLGMTCGQFTQVAMLPQGRFMTFLRAKSEERQKVLQALFRTDRFEQVERWLVERRVELRRLSQAANDRVRGVLDRFQEAAGQPLPEGWDPVDLAVPATTGEITDWAKQQVAVAAEAAARAAVRRAASVTSAEAAAGVLRDAEQLIDLQHRAREAVRLEAALEASADQAGADADRLDRHRRALPVSRLAAGAERTRIEAERAHRHAHEALAEVAGLLAGDLDLAAAEERTTAALAVAEAFRPRQAELQQLARRCKELADQRLALAEEAEGLQQRLDSAPDRLQEATAAVEASRQAAAGVAAAHASLRDAEAVLAAAQELVRVEQELTVVEAEVRTGQDQAQGLRQHWLDLREVRVQGMAAELAGQLAVGCACPVCGSADHPAPASLTLWAVGQAEEDAAHKAYEDANFDLQLLAEKAAELRTRRTALEARADGRDIAAAATAVEACRAQLAALTRDAEGLAGHTAALDVLRANVEAAERRRSEIEARLEGVRVAHQGASDQVEQLTAELAELLAGSAAESLDELVGNHERARAVLARARAARQAAEVTTGAATTAAEALEEAAVQAGFAEAAEAVAAVLDPAHADALHTALEERRAQAQHVATLLADPSLRAALAEHVPDLATLRTAATASMLERDQAAALEEAARTRSQRLETLSSALADALSAWGPVRDQHATVGSLAALVEGKGADNPQRIRLSAYVLGERLRQVVDAANDRLARMSGSRYLLEQTDDRAAGDVRGGLSLLVRDAWSGQARDPATLSGGETFIVSLALALGLADTVCHEAGGTDIDTLFIDEGFGTLDADTLDDVMDTLDGLREGGRVVGLVSHVPELRTRIPTQLEVTKTRAGSGLRALVSTG